MCYYLSLLLYIWIEIFVSCLLQKNELLMVEEILSSHEFNQAHSLYYIQSYLAKQIRYKSSKLSIVLTLCFIIFTYNLTSFLVCTWKICDEYLLIIGKANEWSSKAFSCCKHDLGICGIHTRRFADFTHGNLEMDHKRFLHSLSGWT